MPLRTSAAKITNFDSTMQLGEWERIAAAVDADTAGIPGEVPCPSASDLWFKNGLERRCERLLNDHVQFATHFAGVIRTAYLYCPRILLTDAELFDGIFFLALGPATVNGILGKSYKDGPSIIVSGRQPTLEQCLVAFTVSTIVTVQEKVQTANPNADSQDLPCAGRPDQYTIRPLEYSALDRTVTEQEALSLPASFYTTFTNRLAEAEANGTGKAAVIAEAFAHLFPDDGDTRTADRFRFLGQRWQEWIDAERQGLILYENQNSPEFAARVHSPGFDHYFAANAERCRTLLLNQYRLPNDLAQAHGITNQEHTFVATLNAIAAVSRRSDAFRIIAGADLPDGHAEDPAQPPDDRHEARLLTKRMLRDWYQFVYQQTMANHLGTRLIAVAASGNSFAQMVGRDDRRNVLMLDGSITDQLGQMPFVRFAQFCYESRNAISQWRECGTDAISNRKRGIRTRDIAYAVEQAAQERSLQHDAMNLLWGLIFTLALALLSAVSDNVWLNGNAPIALIVFVAWAIAVAPNIVDVCQWMWGVRSASKTVVYLAEPSA
ncbi:hypothetical protein [Bifidobacterium pullorum]|uniref:hypothetical protein n=1 Tax=Bifidobacterium pullorum TaxID=78448 RepID=UPI0005299396|nr:hypothetical protein [Bifidobacterium pullorum]